MAKRTIDTDRTAGLLRSRILSQSTSRILMARIEGSSQARDLTVPPNSGGFGRIRHFKRQTARGWPPNPLPIDPACSRLGIPKVDVMRVQAFQNAGCAWRCWYCFVPYDLLAGDPKKGAWLSAKELIDQYMVTENRPPVIDLTGGSPDLVPEWSLWMTRELRARGLEDQVYVWSDDNLSTDYFWTHLSESERSEIVSYRNYGRVGCFKGFNEKAFCFNTNAGASAYVRQFEIMRRLVAEGIDCYAYATFTAEAASDLQHSMSEFVDRLQAIHVNLPLRTVPLRIEPFSPVVPRLTQARQNSLAIQEEAIAAWNAELQSRFSAEMHALPIEEVPCGPRVEL